MGETIECCPFLQLPTELRLLIYGFALLDTPAITIGTAELVGAPADIVHRLYGNQRSPVPGIPRKHEAIIEPRYSSSLLSITDPAIIPLTSTSHPPDNGTDHAPYTTHRSLLLVNKRIKDELSSHFNLPQSRRTSLFISYPHGLHVLKTLTPSLPRQARSVHIAGVYIPKTFNAQRAAAYMCNNSPLAPFPHPTTTEDSDYHGNTTPNHPSHLATLIASLFGPSPTYPGVQALELRIYYPGSDSYSTVWGDDSSPTVVALRNIFAGEISIEVWRGRCGTGVYLTAMPTRLGVGEEGERPKKTVSTVWRKLEEGRRGEPEVGSWVVDPRWPRWGGARERGEGEGVVVREGGWGLRGG